MSRLFRTILVPHDLSRHASRAFKIAAALAGPRGRLIVLHVANEYGNPRVQQTVVEDARRALERIAPRTLRPEGGPAIERRVEVGNPYLRIIDAARRADSIVICTAGRTGLSHFVIGSVAEKVVRHAPVPVLSFRPGARMMADLRTSRASGRARASRRSHAKSA